ncbi:hypothetical protein Bwad006_04470 [Bilophila wadsworthia]
MNVKTQSGYVEERERERERERESLRYLTNTSDIDIFSLVFYSYRKIPGPSVKPPQLV